MILTFMTDAQKAIPGTGIEFDLRPSPDIAEWGNYMGCSMEGFSNQGLVRYVDIMTRVEVNRKLTDVKISLSSLENSLSLLAKDVSEEGKQVESKVTEKISAETNSRIIKVEALTSSVSALEQLGSDEVTKSTENREASRASVNSTLTQITTLFQTLNERIVSLEERISQTQSTN